MASIKHSKVFILYMWKKNISSGKISYSVEGTLCRSHADHHSKKNPFPTLHWGRPCLIFGPTPSVHHPQSYNLQHVSPWEQAFFPYILHVQCRVLIWYSYRGNLTYTLLFTSSLKDVYSLAWKNGMWTATQKISWRKTLKPKGVASHVLYKRPYIFSPTYSAIKMIFLDLDQRFFGWWKLAILLLKKVPGNMVKRKIWKISQENPHIWRKKVMK